MQVVLLHSFRRPTQLKLCRHVMTTLCALCMIHDMQGEYLEVTPQILHGFDVILNAAFESASLFSIDFALRASNEAEAEHFGC